MTTVAASVCDELPIPAEASANLTDGRLVDESKVAEFDRIFVDGLQELRSFLDAPGNEDQFALVYLENQMEDDPQAHTQAAAAIEAVLGDDVERPPAGSTCEPAPMDASRAEMLGRGHRVLIVGNCGPGAWGGWVFDRGPLWPESGSGGDYPAYPDCDTHGSQASLPGRHRSAPSRGSRDLLRRAVRIGLAQVPPEQPEVRRPPGAPGARAWVSR